MVMMYVVFKSWIPLSFGHLSAIWPIFSRSITLVLLHVSPAWPSVVVIPPAQALGHGDAIRAATDDLLEPPSLLSDDAKFAALNNEMVKLKALHHRDAVRLDAENKELRSQLKSAVVKRSELEQALIIATNSMKVCVYDPHSQYQHPCLLANRIQMNMMREQPSLMCSTDVGAASVGAGEASRANKSAGERCIAIQIAKDS